MLIEIKFQAIRQKVIAIIIIINNLRGFGKSTSRMIIQIAKLIMALPSEG
jgi:hypothetical protein